jgi:Oxidoreductase family, NAD-binding Rossmann fold
VVAVTGSGDSSGAPLRVGVVGGGLVAQVVHLPFLAELHRRFRVVALAEPSARVRERLSARYAIGAAFADHRRMLDAAALDAVIACSPNGTHAEVVLDALAAGTHVLVEKPLCITLADADRIVAARDDSGLVVQVGYMKRFDPAYEALLDDLPEPPALRHLASLTYDPGLAGPFAPADMVLAGDVPAAAAATLARRTAEQVEEAVGTAAPADVTAFSEAFLGALVHDVNAIRGVLRRMGKTGPVAAVDGFAAPDGGACGGTARLDGGVRWTMAWLRIDGLQDFREHLALYAADGVRTLDFPAPYLRRAPAVYARSSAAGGANEQRALRSWDESYLRQLVHFHECVTGAVACRTPPEQARGDIALLTDLFRAAA